MGPSKARTVRAAFIAEDNVRVHNIEGGLTRTHILEVRYGVSFVSETGSYGRSEQGLTNAQYGPLMI